ncbi:flagellar basal-body rod protein FlgF [Aestuariivirga sp.]|jgi:flagellar basal-body rod protein FlgF|uniref:flagellar basal-body rod protein FlgF n=1 Tax=Aestuariivirga sp. TaxID=2650926 RepID=UPI00378410A9
MDHLSPIGIAGQVALMRRLDTVANNVANAETAGFRAEGVTFSSVVSKTRPFDTSFLGAGRSHVDPRSGNFVKTGNQLDVAINGSAFMAVLTGRGIAYTRDGRMQMLPSGELVSLLGHPVLDPSGAPISLDPLGGEVEISRDGFIRQGGRSPGSIGLFDVDFSQGYSRDENSGLIPVAAAQPLEDFLESGFVQGYSEGSNVNPITEITRLIELQRIFEAVNASLEQRDGSLRETIQALGARSA